MLYARITDDGRKQTLYDHLDCVANTTGETAAIIGFAKIGYLTGLLHDSGKSTQAFQDYLLSDGRTQRGSVIHSTQGARLLYESASSLSTSLIAEMLANCVAGHHGALTDGVSPEGTAPLTNKLSEDNSRLYYTEFLAKYQEAHPALANIPALLDACQAELREFLGHCKNSQLDSAFMAQMAVRFLYSCLVDTDRYNAYCFEAKILPLRTTLPPWDALVAHLETYLMKKNANAGDTSIQKIRRLISENCLEAANRPKGIYQLFAPTGGGKTLSGLRFALAHAKKHQMDRIIIVIPYLSVLEQTSAEIREALEFEVDDTMLLEHHSNLIPPEDDELVEKQQLLTERWDATIIVTTMVQFLESIYSHKAGKVRKFHHMANAVMIFDEVQSLPLKCVHLFNQAINFLTNLAGSSALLCTATQPPLQWVNRPINLSDCPSLVQEMQTAFTVLSRTRIVPHLQSKDGGLSNQELLEFAIDKQHKNGDCLVVLNTKATVDALYDALKTRLEGQKDMPELIKLTTHMCPVHRLDVINKMKRDLSPTDTDGNRKTKAPIICVSTQLVEAGVDISFGCVIRALAGLDSVAQAAGRCNRHGEDPNGRDVFLVKLKDENLSRLPDISTGADITNRILLESPDDLLDVSIMNRYYNEYFYRKQKQMDYPLKQGESIYDLLSSNRQGRGALKNRSGGAVPQFVPAYASAGDAFSVIDEITQSVVVPYGKGIEYIKAFSHASLQKRCKLLRLMGRYSVSLYPYEMSRLKEECALTPIAEGVLALDERFYNAEQGVVFLQKCHSWGCKNG